MPNDGGSYRSMVEQAFRTHGLIGGAWSDTVDAPYCAACGR